MLPKPANFCRLFTIPASRHSSLHSSPTSMDSGSPHCNCHACSDHIDWYLRSLNRAALVGVSQACCCYTPAPQVSTFGPDFQAPALVCSFGRGVNRKYGLTILIFGHSSFACSVFTLGATITSSPAKLSAAATREAVKEPHTWYPIDGGGDLVFVACLQRIHHTQYLGRVTTRRGWI